MNILKTSAFVLAAACKGNPVLTTIVVFFFYLAFSSLEAMIEEIVFGKPFLHAVDPLFAGIGIAYSAYCVYQCAVYNSTEQQ